MMKKIVTIGLLAASFFASSAWAAKPCEELSSEIGAKLEAAGVKGYTLDIAASDADEVGAKVVGTCNAGKGKILYRREAAAATAPKAAASAAK